MPETDYRGSRFCRIMGNPTAYQIVKYLLKHNATPSQLSEKIGVSVQTICSTLRHLRNVDIVRYETVKKNKIYFLKDPTLIQVINTIEKYVERIRFKRW